MEAAEAHLSLHMSKCHIVGNLMPRLIHVCIYLSRPDDQHDSDFEEPAPQRTRRKRKPPAESSVSVQHP